MFWQIFYALPFYVRDVLHFEKFEIIETVDAWTIILITVPVTRARQEAVADGGDDRSASRSPRASWFVMGSSPTLTVDDRRRSRSSRSARRLQAPRYYEYVADLAPKEQVGTYMGFAFLPIAIGTFVAGAIARQARRRTTSARARTASSPGPASRRRSTCGTGSAASASSRPLAMLAYDRLVARRAGLRRRMAASAELRGRRRTEDRDPRPGHDGPGDRRGLCSSGRPRRSAALAATDAHARRPPRRGWQASSASRSAPTTSRPPAGADVVVFALKPMKVLEVARRAGGGSALRSPRTLVVSIAAGVTTGQLEELLGAKVPVVRAMPNTPCCDRLRHDRALARAARRTTRTSQRARALFEPLGRVIELEEKHMDTVTGLSASGPAFVYVDPRGARRRRRRARPAAQHGARDGGADGLRRGGDGARDRPAPGGAQGRRHDAGRLHDRRHPGARGRQDPAASCRAPSRSPRCAPASSPPASSPAARRLVLGRVARMLERSDPAAFSQVPEAAPATARRSCWARSALGAVWCRLPLRAPVSHTVLPVGEMGLKPMPVNSPLARFDAGRPAEDGALRPPRRREAGPRRGSPRPKIAGLGDQVQDGSAPDSLLYRPTGGRRRCRRAQLGCRSSRPTSSAALLLAYLLVAIAGSTGAQVPLRQACCAISWRRRRSFAWASISVAHWNWYGFPCAFILAELIDQVVGWTLAGLVMALLWRRAERRAILQAERPGRASARPDGGAASEPSQPFLRREVGHEADQRVDPGLGEGVVDRGADAADRAMALEAVEAAASSPRRRTSSRAPRRAAGR